MLKCDSTSPINKLWKTLNYFRQLISAYKMAAHNYFLVCVFPVCVCVCLTCLVVVLIYSCTFLKRPSQSTSSTAVAVKQFVSLMHFVAAKSSGCQPSQVEPDVLVDLLDPPRRPASVSSTQPTQHKMAQRKRFSMKFMTHGNIRRSLTFTSPRRFLPLLQLTGRARAVDLVSWLMLMLWHQQIYGPHTKVLCVLSVLAFAC